MRIEEAEMTKWGCQEVNSPQVQKLISHYIRQGVCSGVWEWVVQQQVRDEFKACPPRVEEGMGHSSACKREKLSSTPRFAC